MLYNITRKNLSTFNTIVNIVSKRLQPFRRALILKILNISFYVSLVFAGQMVNADDNFNESAAHYSGGISITTQGLGLSLSSRTNLSLTSGDQLQWRLVASGMNVDIEGDDDVDLSGIDYDDIDISLFSLRGGLDWYPLKDGWADEVFLSTGVMFIDAEFEGTADNSQTFFVGSTLVKPGDITSLKTNIESTSFRPYLSLGWGNKITTNGGFDFQAEIGFSLLTNDPKVKLVAVDPGNFLDESSLADEKKEIEDKFDDIVGFATVTISYQF
jgi:hypothetical protein